MTARVAHPAAILACLACVPSATATELSNRLGVPQRSVLRLLERMTDEGGIQQCGTVEVGPWRAKARVWCLPPTADRLPPSLTVQALASRSVLEVAWAAMR